MESYRKLYHIAVNHDYFDMMPCSVLRFRLARQSALLARQRNLLFRQIAVDAWDVLFDSTGAGVDTENDVLTLEINITDPNFTIYTKWTDFSPAAAHVLKLPVAEETVDAASVICRADEKRKVGTPFCTVNLRLTEELMEAAKTSKPKQVLLHFDVPKVQWEYIFLPRSEDISTPGRFSLEDVTDKINFSAFEECEVYGKSGLRTISNERIPMRKTYENRMRMVEHNDGGQQRRTLLAHISPPELDRFQSGQSGIIRQVCYY